MTQEQKELLKDLCARLPYEVKCDIEFDDGKVFHKRILMPIMIQDLKSCESLKAIKPYLFPLSSMTEEQRIELYKVLGWGYESHYHLSKEWEDFNESIDNNGLFLPASWVSELNKMYNWLNKNHFDYRGLIKKSLALDATNLGIYE